MSNQTVRSRLRLGRAPQLARPGSLALPWVYDDGGRYVAGYEDRDAIGDCAVRSIAIARGVGYQVVLDDLHEIVGDEHYARGFNPMRTGVPISLIRYYLAGVGWTWTPTMAIGSGTTVHLRRGELPAGRVIARVTKHITAVIDGAIYDTHDPGRGGTRCVYGFWTKENAS